MWKEWTRKCSIQIETGSPHFNTDGKGLYPWCFPCHLENTPFEEAQALAQRQRGTGRRGRFQSHVPSPLVPAFRVDWAASAGASEGRRTPGGTCNAGACGPTGLLVLLLSATTVCEGARSPGSVGPHQSRADSGDGHWFGGWEGLDTWLPGVCGSGLSPALCRPEAVLPSFCAARPEGVFQPLCGPHHQLTNSTVNQDLCEEKHCVRPSAGNLPLGPGEGRPV